MKTRLRQRLFNGVGVIAISLVVLGVLAPGLAQAANLRPSPLDLMGQNAPAPGLPPALTRS